MSDGSVERTDVRFEGVLGYLFLDSLGGILLDILEDSIERVLEEFADEIAKWSRLSGWPGGSFGRGDTRAHLEAASARAFRVHSSIGFEGFVIARSLSIEPAKASS